MFYHEGGGWQPAIDPSWLTSLLGPAADSMR